MNILNLESAYKIWDCRFAVIFIWFLLAAIDVKSQDSVNTVLFSVSHPELGHTSYLFGTHHAFSKSFFDSLDVAAQSLKACKVLVKENENIAGETAVDLINRRESTTKWNKLLRKEDVKSVQTLLTNSGFDYRKVTPAELSAAMHRVLTIEKCKTRLASDPVESLDDYIEKVANLWDIRVLGLESVASQLKIINEDVANMPNRIHKKRLTALIDARNDDNATYSCEEAMSYREMRMPLNLEEPCPNAVMLTNRNKEWLEKIIPLLPEYSCFVAVGYSHLMYECGLIAQLRELGYVVESVNVK